MTAREPQNDDKTPFYKDGLRFTCKQCSACCRFEPGIVRLSDGDITAICTLRSLTRAEFVAMYCRYVDTEDGQRLSLRERKNNDCIFWRDGCAVYEARPLQCRSYPFWAEIVASKESWEDAAKGCPGIGEGELHSRAEIDGWLEAQSAYNAPRTAHNPSAGFDM